MHTAQTHTEPSCRCLGRHETLVPPHAGPVNQISRVERHTDAPSFFKVWELLQIGMKGIHFARFRFLERHPNVLPRVRRAEDELFLALQLNSVHVRVQIVVVELHTSFGRSDEYLRPIQPLNVGWGMFLQAGDEFVVGEGGGEGERFIVGFGIGQ